LYSPVLLEARYRKRDLAHLLLLEVRSEFEHHDPRVLVDNLERFYDGISLIHHPAKVDGVQTVVEDKESGR